MATGDQLVLTPQATGPLNAAYATAGAQALQMIAATATFDGSGAAGAFKPALAFYDSGGVLLSRAVAEDTVSAGDSAEVSFFPFVPQSSGSGPAASLLVTDGSTSVPGVSTLDFTSGATVSSGGAGIADVAISGGGYSPNPAAGTYQSGTDSIPSGGNTHAAISHVGGSSLLDLTTPTAPLIVTRGVYFIGGTFQSGSTWNDGAALLGIISVGSSPNVDAYQGVQRGKATIGPIGYVSVVVQCAVNTPITFSCTNWDSGARDVVWFEIVVTKILEY